MTARDGTKGKNRRRMAIVGGAVGAFAAAAAMATGSAVTAAPAKADIDALLDPIIQPLMTSLTDAVAGFDPAAATDITSWTDSLLSSLNSIDLAAPSAAEPAAAAAASSDSSTTGVYNIPISMQEVTEPTVQATVDGQNTTLLVDTGSSGLVVPYSDFGSNLTQQIDNIAALGTPTGSAWSGYSGGVDYYYLEYNGVSTDYGNGVLDTTGPVDVEIYSYDPSNLFSFFTNDAFQNFDVSNHVTGVLGIGDSASDGGPTESPLQAAGFTGVTVDIPQDKLIVDPSNPFVPIAGASTLTGAPIPSGNLTETVTTGTGGAVGTAQVSDDIDSGGVYGTIPSSIDSSTLAQGDVVTVSNGSTVLYSYTVGTDSGGTNEAPGVVSGSSIDSGVEPYLHEPIYINYTDDTLTFDTSTMSQT